MDIILVIFFGLIIGSFLGMCSYRIPIIEQYWGMFEEGEENDLAVVIPQSQPTQQVGFLEPARSLCPHCAAQLRWWHNIPLISWLLLRGKCGFCEAKIGVRYPVIELFSALLAVLSYAQFGYSLAGILSYAFAATLLLISVIDYDFYIIPDLLSIPAKWVGLFAAAFNDVYGVLPSPFVRTPTESLIGILAGGGFLLLISKLYLIIRKQEGLGLGDVKLLYMVGAFFGPECALFTIFIGSLLGAVIGGILVLFCGRAFSKPIPFGPYLALAALVYLYGGMNLLRALQQAPIQ